jgi:hypothetical protein
MFRVRDGLVAVFVMDKVKKQLTAIDQTEIIVNEKYPKFKRILKVSAEYTDLTFCVYDMYKAPALSNTNLLGYCNVNVAKLLGAPNATLESKIIDHATKLQLKMKATLICKASLVDIVVRCASTHTTSQCSAVQ